MRFLLFFSLVLCPKEIKNNQKMIPFTDLSSFQNMEKHGILTTPSRLKMTPSKTLFIIVGIPGSSKSEFTQLLVHLYNISHIQRDNYFDEQDFDTSVMTAFKTHSIVFADRNNHRLDHGEYLLNTVKREYPDTLIIALQWIYHSYDPPSHFYYSRINRNINITVHVRYSLIVLEY